MGPMRYSTRETNQTTNGGCTSQRGNLSNALIFSKVQRSSTTVCPCLYLCFSIGRNTLLKRTCMKRRKCPLHASLVSRSSNACTRICLVPLTHSHPEHCIPARSCSRLPSLRRSDVIAPSKRTLMNVASIAKTPCLPPTERRNSPVT